MSFLWTLVPFLMFLGVILRYESKHRRRERKLAQETERYMRPLARTTGRMYQKQYGRASTDIESAFPEIRAAK